MGIRVECPNGHNFKVKDKYAGKKGLCPHCTGQVVVQVPDALTTKEMSDAYHQAFREERDTHHGSIPASDSHLSTSSVLDDVLDHNSGTSGSLLGSSVIRHHVRCKCGASVPMWFARCPECGHYMEEDR